MDKRILKILNEHAFSSVTMVNSQYVVFNDVEGWPVWVYEEICTDAGPLFQRVPEEREREIIKKITTKKAERETVKKMSDITITITIKDKGFEVANMLLAQAVKEVQEKAALREYWDIDLEDVEAAEAFRMTVLEAVINTAEQGGGNG